MAIEAPAAPAAPEVAPTEGDPTEVQAKTTPIPPEAKAPLEAKPEDEAKTKAERRKYKLKLEGKDEEAELTDEEVSAELQKARVASKRMQESAEIRKKSAAQDAEVRELFDALRNPATAPQILKQLGLDVRSLVEADLVREFEESQLSPEQKKLRDMEAKLKEYETRDQTDKAKQDEAEASALEKQMVDEMAKSWAVAAEKAGLDDSPRAVKAMADLAAEYAAHEIYPSPDQIAAEVRSNLEELNKTQHLKVLKSLSGKRRLEYLGKDLVELILTDAMESIKGQSVAPPPAPEPVDAPKIPDQISPAEFRRMMGL